MEDLALRLALVMGSADGQWVPGDPPHPTSCYADIIEIREQVMGSRVGQWLHTCLH